MFLPESAPWLKDFQNELLAFPNGRHDDQVELPGTGARVTHQAQKAAAEDYRRSSQRMAAVI